MSVTCKECVCFPVCADCVFRGFNAEGCENFTRKQRWIPVTESLPEKGRTVLCYRAQNDMRVAEILGVHPRQKDIVAFTNREWNTVFTATHWLPLPEAPKEGE